MNMTNFWSGVVAFLVQSGWNLLAAAAIIGGAFLLSWLLRVLIRHVVRQIVSGVKRKQNGDDTQAIAASPLAAVRVVQRTRTLGTVLSNIINVSVAIVAAILVIDKIAPNVIGSL